MCAQPQTTPADIFAIPGIYIVVNTAEQEQLAAHYATVFWHDTVVGLKAFTVPFVSFKSSKVDLTTSHSDTSKR
jgi:hypothetical protein